MAKPLITTDNVGCRDVVLPGVGWLCPVKDARIIDCCEQLILLNPDQCRAMGKLGVSLCARN